MRDIHGISNSPSGFSSTFNSLPMKDGAVDLEEVTWLTSADFERAGPDLVITSPTGEEILLVGYFNQSPLPSISGAGDMAIPGSVVNILSGPQAPGQYAQATGAPAGQPIGQIETVEGSVYVVRVDGTRDKLSLGDPIFQGDTLETEGDGVVGVTFADESTLSLDGDSRMVIDDMVYDPGSAEGSGAMFLLEGAMSFVSGQIAKTNPDALTITTPVATIGIRGTSVLVSSKQSENEGGAPQTAVAIMPEEGPDGQTVIGEAAVTTQGGTQVISKVFEGVAVSSSTEAPSQPQTVSMSEVARVFGNAIGANPSSNGVPSSLRNTVEKVVVKQKAEDKRVEAENKTKEAEQKANEAQNAANEAAAKAEEAAAKAEELAKQAAEEQDPEKKAALEKAAEEAAADAEAAAGEQAEAEAAAEEAQESLEGAQAEQDQAAQEAEAAAAEADAAVGEFAESVGNTDITKDSNLTGANQPKAEQPKEEKPAKEAPAQQTETEVSDDAADAPEPVVVVVEQPPAPAPEPVIIVVDPEPVETEDDDPEPVDQNTAPNARTAELSGKEDNSIIFDRSDILSNVIDSDAGDTVELLTVGGQALNANFETIETSAGYLSYDAIYDKFTFTPHPNYNGDASFEYTVSDGQATSSSNLLFQIDAVNDAPEVIGSIAAHNGTEDTSLQLDLSGISLNDIDSDTLTITLNAINGSFGWPNTDSNLNFSGDSQGQTITVSGSIEHLNNYLADPANTIPFTPDPNVFGTGAAGYEIEISDEDGGILTPNPVDIHLTGVDDTLIANDATIAGDEDHTIHFTINDVLANIVDVDNDPVQLIEIAGRSVNAGYEWELPDETTTPNGTLSFDGTVFTFLPNTDFNGIESLRFRVTDGVLSVPEADLLLSYDAVNDLPVIETTTFNGLTASTDEAVAAPLSPSDDIEHTKIIAQPDGSYAIFWTAHTSIDGWDIYGQLFDANKNQLGGPFLVNDVAGENGGSNQALGLSNSITTTPDGGYMVAWTSDTSPPRNVFYRKIDVDDQGHPNVTAPVQSLGASGYDKEAGALQSLGGDFYLLSWTEEAAPNNVYTQVIKEDGTTIGNAVEVTAEAGFSVLANATPQGSVDTMMGSMQVLPDYDTSDEFVNVAFAFTEGNGDGTGKNAYVSVYQINTLTGEMLLENDSPFLIHPTNEDVDDQIVLSSTILNSGHMVVAYETPDSDMNGVMFSIVDPYSGELIIDSKRLNSSETGNQTDAMVKAMPDGGFVAVWSTSDSSITNGDGNGGAIRAQRFDAQGQTVGFAITVNTTSAGEQKYPDVIVTDNGLIEFVFADSTSNEVYSRYYYAGGEESLTPVHDIPHDTTQGDLTYNGTIDANDNKDSGSLTFSIIEQPMNGTATIDPNTGDYSYDAPSDFGGHALFFVRITDNNGGSTVLPISIDVNAPYRSPEIVNTTSDIHYCYVTDSPINPFGAVDIKDIDSNAMTNATVTIEGFQAGDELTATYTPTGNVTISYDDLTGIMTITGTDSTVEYEKILQSIEYTNDQADADSDREIKLEITDTNSMTSTFVREVNLVNTDPLVFDMDGDGTELLSVDAGVSFDIDADGEKEATGWVAPDDALLVLDDNKDGLINDMSEVVSPYLEFNGEKVDDGVTSSFEALAQFDDNKDNLIDKNDAIFEHLQLWQDANSNGISEDGELKNLTELGIESIDLKYTVINGKSEGNTLLKEGNATNDNGDKMTVTEVAFETKSDSYTSAPEQNILTDIPAE